MSSSELPIETPTAAAKSVPKDLLHQVKDGGAFLGPVEKEDESQEVIKLTRRGNEFDVERLRPCSFVRLIRGVAGNGADGPAELSQGSRYGG